MWDTYSYSTVVKLTLRSRVLKERSVLQPSLNNKPEAAITKLTKYRRVFSILPIL